MNGARVMRIEIELILTMGLVCLACGCGRKSCDEKTRTGPQAGAQPAAVAVAPASPASPTQPGIGGPAAEPKSQADQQMQAERIQHAASAEALVAPDAIQPAQPERTAMSSSMPPPREELELMRRRSELMSQYAAKSFRVREWGEALRKQDKELRQMQLEIADKQAQLEKRLNEKHPDFAKLTRERDELSGELAKVDSQLAEMRQKRVGKEVLEVKQ